MQGQEEDATIEMRYDHLYKCKLYKIIQNLSSNSSR